MKRTDRGFRRATFDNSHRNFRQIQNGYPEKKKVKKETWEGAYIPPYDTGLRESEMELAKKQLAAYLESQKKKAE